MLPPPLRLFCCAALLFTGCARESNPRNFAVSEPTKESVAGTYHATESTKTLIAATGKYESKPDSIMLHADGSVEVESLPDCWILPYDQAIGQFDTGKGTWSLVRQQQWWVLMCKFPALPNHAARGTDHGNVTAMISLVGQRPPYVLECVIAHPEAELALQFERAPAAK